MAPPPKTCQSKDKTVGVHWFNQFPKNFLRPYGPAMPFPDQDTALRRVQPQSCEWLRRPQIAMSELAETIIENTKIILQQQLAPERLMKFEEDTGKMRSLLALHLKNFEDRPSEKKTKRLVQSLIKPPGEVDDMMSSFVKLGGAMFAMGVNFKMAQLLLSNPAALAEKFDSRPAPDPKFKESGKILDFIELLNPMPKGKRKAEESVQDVLDELESDDGGDGGKKKKKKKSSKKSKKAKKM